MFKAGIVDAAFCSAERVTLAASIAALFLTTEAVVAEKPEKEKPMPPMPGGGGDMDF
jgi:chaperonin GroEL